MKGQVAFVTGAGSGIGKGIAKRFAAEGANVVITDLSDVAARETQKEIARDLAMNNLPPVKLHTLSFDVTDEEAVIQAFAETADVFNGQLNTVVCNAGVQHIAPVHELAYNDWKRVLAVHLDASFLCTREALKIMYPQNSGSLIYIGSVHSKTASMLKAPYVSAKHGVLGLCRTVAKEGAAHNVRANVICPGFVLTPLVEKQIAPQAEKFGMTEEEVVQKVFLKDTVDGKWSTVEDIADAAVMFAAPISNALTGQSIIVSHGWFME